MASLEEQLGIDPTDDLYRHALHLQDVSEKLIIELIESRKRHKLSQRDVAARLGVTQPTVADFERSGNDPRLSTIRKYAMAIRADFTFLVYDRNSVRLQNWAKDIAAKSTAAAETHQQELAETISQGRRTYAGTR